MKNILKYIFITFSLFCFSKLIANPGFGSRPGPRSETPRPRRPAPSKNSKSYSKKPSDSVSSKNASGEKNSSDVEKEVQVLNYRGNRVLSTGGDFEFSDIKIQRLNSLEVSMEISFNQSVNPYSFSNDSIYINNEPIPDETKIFFNRKGDTIKISVPLTEDEFSLKIQNVESFDGTLLNSIEIENLTDTFGGN